MAGNIKPDAVIDAVHFNPDGSLKWARGYQRRGSSYSDLVMFDRAALIDLLKKGKKVYLGQRQTLLASTFELDAQVRLGSANGKEIILSGNASGGSTDSLPNAPLV